jgi:hypothetical protein
MHKPIPSGIALALNECANRKPADLVKLTRDKRFRQELADQCEAAAEHYIDGSFSVDGDFPVYAAGGFTPFSPFYKCCELSCRLAQAEGFARSTCLYAETVIAPDGFSRAVNSLRPNELLTELLVLRTLGPLIDAGVIQFAPSASGFCTSCKEAITGTFDAVEADLWHKMSDTYEFRLQHGNRKHEIQVTSPFDASDGISLPFDIRPTRQDLRELQPYRWVRGKEARRCVDRHERELREHIRGYVAELLFDVGHAGPTGAVIGTNHKMGGAALRVIDGRAFGESPLTEWEEHRSVQLPWIKGLNAADVLRVREEAAPALPAFRRRLQRDLLSPSANVSEDAQARRLASDLRQDALELQEKLRAVNLPAVRRAPNLFAGLGLAIGLYGLATGAVATGLAAFAAMIAKAHQDSNSRQQELASLRRQPAYVLVTAHRISQRH